MTVRDFRTGRVIRRLQADSRGTHDAAFSPDGKTLAVASYEQIKLLDLATGKARSFPEPHLDHLEWCRDGRLLAAGVSFPQSTTVNKAEVRVWDAATGRLLHTLGTEQVSFRGRYGAVAFSPDGRPLAASDGHATRVWRLDASPPRLVRTLPQAPNSPRFSSDGRVLLAGDDAGGIHIYQTATGTLLATAVALNGGKDWAVVSPQGFFDGSPGGQKLMRWRFGRTLASLEQFYGDFYHPGLLADVVREAKPVPAILKERGDPRWAMDIARQDRRVPLLAIGAPTATAQRTVEVQVRILNAPAGARDVRLFRNGTLVARWSGNQKPGALTTHLTVAAGINHYALSDHDLKYAVADATDMAAALRGHLPAPVHVTLLLDRQATRRGIVQALAAIVKQAQPEDTVVVDCSGHGIHDHGHFYVVPYDIAGAKTESDLVRLGVGS